MLSVETFEDEDRRDILLKIDAYCKKLNGTHDYDERIDKRKYSHLKNWMESRLSAVDVDERFEWMADLEKKIMTDSIQMSEEKQLLKEIKNYEAPGFYFIRLYELVKVYRHFLLIRMRYSDHQLVQDFLFNNETAYQKSIQINEKLHEATYDIVQHYSGQSEESLQWEHWLKEVFYDDDLDGHLRYMAFIRLAFIKFNYQKFNELLEPLDYLDKQFSKGAYYSKRILSNYYNTRVMLHSKFGEYQKAMFYGYLSIRNKTHDYILYVNNLCAVLLRLKKNEDALELMKLASGEMKTTKNFHNRIGFVSFYVEALNKNKLYKNAENYAETYLKAFEKEILQYRWHLFFSVFFEALLYRNQYGKIFRLERKYKLLERDKSYQSKANYLPTIPWYIEIAKYISGQNNNKQLLAYFDNELKTIRESANPSRLENLISNVKEVLPSELAGLKL
ncbi:MAG: hypothetical protein R2769_16505 [Saprospiraceae bacterium]